MEQIYLDKKPTPHIDKGSSLKAELMVSIYDSNESSYCPKSAFRSTGYGILMITKGSLEIRIDFVSYTFSYRDILCLLPDHIYEIPNEPNASVIYTYFNEEYLSAKGVFFNRAETYRIAHEDKELLKFSLSKSEYDRLYADMKSLQDKLTIPKHTRYIDDIIHNRFLSILYDIFLLNEKQKKLDTSNVNSKIELTNRFLSLVSERFKTEKRVLYYAKCLKITPRHLSQVVKQVTGRSAGEFIDDYVIKEAKLLLSLRIMNISEIAEKLSFSNPSFFGKYFKKHTGISPLLFKKDNKIMVE
ncbi:helix-turn-helix domain-containing protein [Pedobacter sp. MC2016-05]|uniref:helix-turn-helix domain-containing protein n=1 Tax=Pedobacter sp. MC2016-05 TaxID=2994474 RepID=UPI0022451BC8|nr:helix-turn-helix domain-containing protein [Pedobacter sp. MC2016-05]MCX2475339.1 helix-turn-helix domain-containing protein [Pedobacter sp. MC2016-05]